MLIPCAVFQPQSPNLWPLCVNILDLNEVVPFSIYTHSDDGFVAQVSSLPPIQLAACGSRHRL